ncbi:MAG: ribosomal L7Ae/L30e/S12e/Gadd45 family protein [Oscillospiraceae bacterium]|nr:ribosomal L7Ae/L30e/S12e/Gadd45 family protein [Oscillospiraceae bacterium]
MSEQAGQAFRAIHGLLGMARRSGHLIMGFDAAAGLITQKKAKLILLASDISPKTEKELRFAASKAENELVWLRLTATKDELAAALGLKKPIGIIAIDDNGFANAVITRFNDKSNH